MGQRKCCTWVRYMLKHTILRPTRHTVDGPRCSTSRIARCINILMSLSMRPAEPHSAAFHVDAATNGSMHHGVTQGTATSTLIRDIELCCLSRELTLYVHPCSSDSRTPRIISRIALTEALDTREEAKNRRGHRRPTGNNHLRCDNVGRSRLAVGIMCWR